MAEPASFPLARAGLLAHKIPSWVGNRELLPNDSPYPPPCFCDSSSAVAARSTLPQKHVRRQCTAHQTWLNSRSTGKSFIHRLLQREVIRLESTPVSMKEPSRSASSDKLHRGWKPLVGFEGNSRLACW